MFLDYCIIGGVPAVVRSYIENGTFEGTLEMQRQLLSDYQEDIRKYADGMDQTIILNVYNHIPAQEDFPISAHSYSNDISQSAMTTHKPNRAFFPL